jgi:hypothetical protein
MVYLALSQKAAKLLYPVLDPEEFEDKGDVREIFTAIRRDLNEQIERPKRKAK